MLADTEYLDDMYETYKAGKSEILLWCHIPIKHAHRRSKAVEDGVTTSKCKCNETNDTKLDEVTDIIEALKKEHGSSFTPEQMHAWAHLIHISKHESRIQPPDFPFFRGKSSSKKVSSSPKKTAKPEDSSSAGETPEMSAAVSPGKRIALRTKCIEQLEKWHSLLEKGVVTEDQYSKLQQSK